MLGTPYVWGGNAPGGFDCSGLTSWAYRQAGIEIPRTAENQAIGQQVSHDDLQPGDLIVWSGHVAMYAGDGMMVEAGDPVQLNRCARPISACRSKGSGGRRPSSNNWTWV